MVKHQFGVVVYDHRLVLLFMIIKFRMVKYQSIWLLLKGAKCKLTSTCNGTWFSGEGTHGWHGVSSCIVMSILKACRYRELLPHLKFTGPTSFAPVIEKAMTIVEESGGQYHVLVIIIDGQVTRSVDTGRG